MKEKFSPINSFYNSVSALGENYAGVLSAFFSSFLKKPLTFIYKILRRTVRFIFRCLVVLFSPFDAPDKEYTDAVTKAAKKSVKTLFTQPGSFFPVLGYYIKKAFTRYHFGIKNIALWAVALISITSLIAGAKILSSRSLALTINCNGEVIGVVRDEDGFIKARNIARDILNSSESKDFELPEMTYSLTLAGINEFTDENTLSERILRKAESDLVSACAVFIDGELLSVVYSENEARDIFSEILSEKKADEKNYVVSFAEDIEYRHGLYPKESISTKEQLKKNINSGNKETSLYVTKSDETAEEIARKYEMTTERFYELNENHKNTKEFSSDTVLIVEKPGSFLTYKEVKTEVLTQRVNYDKLEIKSSALYSGSTKILSNGKEGFDQVTNFVTYENGKRVSSSEVSRLSITQPIPERIQIGTKPLDESYSNTMGGIFLWPIVGAYGINSDYGYRWGKLHAGIDLGMGNEPGTSLGKTIIAVAQGTVVLAGVHSSYGYYVKIDHGNGLQTLYAHCLADSLLVTPGQVVVAGQPIARVGSTGYSTGPHLHFEVRVNGNRVDPGPYLGI